MVFDNYYHHAVSFAQSTQTTYHHHGILVNGQTLVCNDSQIDNCVKQCARQFMPVDQRACVQAVEARFAPYSKCFSASSLVFVKRKQGPVQLKDLEVGDEVLDVDLQYVKVIGWLHRDESLDAEFIELSYGSVSLEVTPDHLLYCAAAQDYVQAKFARTLETLFFDGSMVPRRIESKRSVHKTGIYAPLTASGTLLVNGINASCYASPGELSFSISQSAGQIALAPYRYLGGASFLPELQEYCKTLYSIFAV